MDDPMMSEWLLSSHAWGVLFVALMALEIFMPGAIAGFAGLGALVVSLAIEFGLADEPEEALLVWVIATVLSAIALWKPLRRRAMGRDTSDAEEGIEPFVNDLGEVLEEPLSRGGGIIRLHGARMKAVLSEDAALESVAVGATVKVTGKDESQRFVVIPN